MQCTEKIGAMHMMAAGLGCKKALVGSVGGASLTSLTNWFRKCHSYRVGASFLAVWVLNNVCWLRMLVH